MFEFMIYIIERSIGKVCKPWVIKMGSQKLIFFRDRCPMGQKFCNPTDLIMNHLETKHKKFTSFYCISPKSIVFHGLTYCSAWAKVLFDMG